MSDGIEQRTTLVSYILHTIIYKTKPNLADKNAIKLHKTTGDNVHIKAVHGSNCIKDDDMDIRIVY